MRIITALGTTLLIASTAAAAQSQILTDAQALNHARGDRVAAEIALQEAIVKGKAALRKDGYAAPLEVDMAQLKLVELEAIRSAIVAYEGFLDELAAKGSDESIIAPADTIMIEVTGAHPDASTQLFQCDNCQEVRKLSSQIATARRSARGQLQAIKAESRFLERFITRLQNVVDDSAAGASETELARLRLVVVRSRLAMGEARQQYDATRDEPYRDENRAGLPIDLADRTIDDAVQLVDALATAWQDHLTRARTESAVARLAFHSKYRNRLAKLNHRPPRHVVSTQWVAFSGPTTSDRRPVRQLRERLEKVRQLADNDEVFANESQRGELELDVALAQEALSRQAQRHEALAQRVASAVARTTVHTVTTGDDNDTPTKALTTYFEFLTASRAARDLANSRIALLQWKLSNLRPLRKVGYATWKEVAIAERNLAIAKAHQHAADERRQIAELELRRVRLIAERSVGNGLRAVSKTAMDPSIY